jgi:hypothetical protein
MVIASASATTAASSAAAPTIVASRAWAWVIEVSGTPMRATPLGAVGGPKGTAT